MTGAHLLVACNIVAAEGFAQVDLGWQRDPLPGSGARCWRNRLGEYVVPVTFARDLRGRAQGTKLYLGPRWYERHDAAEIEAMAAARGYHLIEMDEAMAEGAVPA